MIVSLFCKTFFSVLFSYFYFVFHSMVDLGRFYINGDTGENNYLCVCSAHIKYLKKIHYVDG